MIQWIGFLGLLCIAAAWIPQAYHTWKTRHAPALLFTLLYLCGSVLLIMYSVSIGDGVFIALNSVAFALAFFTLLISWRR